MIEKYRVNDVAKDLNVPSKDVIDLLSESFPAPKKNMTALTEDELNVVFEHFTKEHEVESFAPYFAMAGQPKPEAKSVPKPEAKPEAKPEVKPEVKPEAKPEVKPAPKPEVKPVPKPEVKPEPKPEVKPAPKPEVKPEPKPEVKPEPKPEVKPEPKPEIKPAPKPEVKPEAKPEIKAEPPAKPEPRFLGNDPSLVQKRPQPAANRPQPQQQTGFTLDHPPQQQTGFTRPQPQQQTGFTAPRPAQQQTGFTAPRPAQQQTGFTAPRPAQQQTGFTAPRPAQQQTGFTAPRPAQQQTGFTAPRPAQQQTGFTAPRPAQQQTGFTAPRPPQQGGFNRPPQQGGFNRPPQQGGFNRPPQQGGGFNRPPQNNAPKTPKKPVERKPRPSNLPPAEKLGAGVAHVDMRASNVELEKYNEKYEQIAPAAATKDTIVKKQKLNQRSAQRGRPQKNRHEQEMLKMKKLEMERQRRQKLEIVLPEQITVGELALRLKVQAAEIIKRLIQQGVMAAISDMIDYDTAALVAMEIGAKVEHEVLVTIEDRLIDASEDDSGNLVERNPIVVVMGHVDHGKTSILDYIRNAHVTSTEAGGITQHIGAYRVKTSSGRYVTFLDTPGHEAFTSMRARGALCTDIAILVVAADDGIMPQTVEAINHAKAAGVSIIVAINKIDKPDADPSRIMQGLTEYELVPEEWGGDVICVPVSAKTGEGIDTLLEMVNLVADVKELKANPDRLAKGTVIEARLDKGRGPIATILVQNGTLHTGDVVIAGTAVGKVRVMTDDHGNKVDEAGPCVPVEVTGLDGVPVGGDVVNAVRDEKLARELVEQREYDAKQAQFKTYQKVTLDNLFSQIEEGEMKELPIIVKADVQGSVEAVKQSLEKLTNAEVRVQVIHGGVGAVNESDVMLASASNAIIVGFNVRPDPVARDSAVRDGVDIRLYRVIYDAIDEVKSALTGMLTPKYRDVDLGRAEVRSVFKISNVGTVAGCYVLEGKIVRTANIRIVRDGIIIADDKLDSLKRFKDDVKEVATGYECGMSLLKFSDLKEGDIFEAYLVEEYRTED